MPSSVRKKFGPTVPAAEAVRRPPARVRRTQEERSTQTRAKLCQAAVELLTDVGHERVTTALIAQRAGVSKGAQAHHFPNKADVLIAALEHLIQSWRPRREEFRQLYGDRPTMEQMLTFLWRGVFGRPDYIAALELMLAARHDAEIQQRQRALLGEWSVERDDMYRQWLPTDAPDEDFHAFLQLNFCVLRGMAIYGGLDQDQQLNDRVLKLWIAMATPMAESMRTAGRRAPRKTKENAR